LGGTHAVRFMFRAEPVVAAGGAFVVSSLLFAGYHHVGPGGEPFESTVFAFRFVAGCILAGLFAARGFAVAVWTHVIYDVICVFRSGAA
jgi:membrane protease YdiL (CAAX protease family)